MICHKNEIDAVDTRSKVCNDFPAISATKDFEKVKHFSGFICVAYGDIITMVYRHVIAAHKLVQKGEKLLYFSKECASNECMGTVDVTYPSMPLFLVYNPNLVEGMLNPVFEYAEGNYGWCYDFAPCHARTVPLVKTI